MLKFENKLKKGLFILKRVVYLYQLKTQTLNIMTATVKEMVSTGFYNEKAIAKFHAKQMKLNNNNSDLADAMVRIYKHNFLIRTEKAI